MSPKTLLNILLPKGERRHHRVSKVQQTLSRHCAAADFVLYYTGATIASALAGRRSPLHRTTTTAAAHGRPPADTQTKTEKRGTKSSAPIALSFIHDWDTSVDNQSLNWEEYYWWYIISWDFKLCQKVMCTSNSIQKSWQLSKPSDHDEAWNLSLPHQKTNHWIQNPPKMGLERILGWTILALLIANCQGKMTYFLKKVCLIYKRRGIF